MSSISKNACVIHWWEVTYIVHVFAQFLPGGGGGGGQSKLGYALTACPNKEYYSQ